MIYTVNQDEKSVYIDTLGPRGDVYKYNKHYKRNNSMNAIVAQLGARMHYAVPGIFHQAGGDIARSDEAIYRLL